ncbi:alpha/beta fold hydrolase [Vibrio sinaloensis]|uniref:alpha/beta fold hydrolase n=1 Tax=Photobacterium sp. (strain ATCC 43367) TaxID=379097 RepID=UPI00206DC494|nr:alpha/beta fold hydrolase [Vibrio sinaloensis]UPQ87870.1 alpha/beta fold hydrolase [Vibrio sinaloensis]
MNDSSYNITPSYTQESNFEQAIQTDIAAFWSSREEGYLKTFDKKSLYWIRLTSAEHTKAIVVVNGRIECCAKYQELFYDLFQQGYDIYSYDHRGQGLSDRMIEDRQMGYVDEFDDYVHDLDVMVRHFQLDHYQKRYLLGHSMGGNIATRYMQTHRSPFDAAALSAPMFGVNVPWHLRPFALMVGQLLTAWHATPTFAPGQVAYFPKPFVGNLLSQSEVRYQWFRDLYEQHPELRIGGASTRWVWQGLMACKQCYLMTRQLKTPLLVMQAGDDQIVSNAAQTRLMKKLSKTQPESQLQVIVGAKHELLFEQDQYRNQALDATLAFFDQY